MAPPTIKSIHLPWHQRDAYWITLFAKEDGFLPPVKTCLEQLGFAGSHDDGMSLCTGRDWKTPWDDLYARLKAMDALDTLAVAFTPDLDAPARRSEMEPKSPEAIQLVSESLWLGDALLDDRLVCYLQPVMGGNDKTVGYESFARVKGLDGTVTGGDRIIAASRALGIEYMIDRMLHIQAIKTFAGSDFNGFLFVNFFPGFIHRPSVYLEGLSETAKSFGLLSKHIVLDFTNSEIPRDIHHLNSVCDYARSRGYSVALDDISSLDSGRRLIPEIRPDFVKIDMQLVHRMEDPGKREVIRALIELTHGNGGSAIAEGVETREHYSALRRLGADLFQGYLFSPPLPVETVLARTGGAAAP
jgi:EAL domain-containing protein (putative c-di-GMP-specific phosphodiesterase class I)